METRKKPSNDHVKITFQVNTNIIGGFFAGIFNAVALHGFDRALYLRSTDSKPKHFFAPHYWSAPFNGLSQTIIQRIFSQGCYFAVRGELDAHFAPYLKGTWQCSEFFTRLSIGTMTGMCTGVLSNANNTVKAYTFNKSRKRKCPTDNYHNTFGYNAAEMWRHGGVKPFCKGIGPSIGRDMQYGAVNEGLNHLLDRIFVRQLLVQLAEEDKEKQKQAVFFASRLFSASIATASASLWNYARNQQVSTHPKQRQPHTFDILCNLWRESNKVKEATKTDKKRLKHIPSNPTVTVEQQSASQMDFNKQESTQSKAFRKSAWFPRIRFFQQRLQIGLGTIRSGAGMALGEIIFSAAKAHLEQLDESKPKKIR